MKGYVDGYGHDGYDDAGTEEMWTRRIRNRIGRIMWIILNMQLLVVNKKISIDK